MIQFSTDESFHYESLRALSHACQGAADICEVLATIQQVKAGDFESFYTAWNNRAERVLAQAEKLTNPISIRDAMFRASTYFRTADFYLHGNWEDPRVMDLWKKQAYCFDTANSHLPIPGERLEIQADGFKIPMLFFKASTTDEKRPTIVMTNGFDGAMEEMYHQFGTFALDRGYNVCCFEGPGQPTVRRYQDLGFIPEWEKVVTPVIDYLATRSNVDMSKLALLGNSFGGYMAPRAAAFEHRLAAVFAIDGIYDFGDAAAVHEVADNEKLMAMDDAALKQWLANTNVPAGPRWAVSHGMWAFKAETLKDFVDAAKAYNLHGLCEKIQCPVFVGKAEDDMFFKGQPEQLVAALGDKATMVTFTDEDGAGSHCHIGAWTLCATTMYDWFEKVIEKK